MINIENELFTIIATTLRNDFPDIYVSGEYVSQPPSFPAVSIVESDNAVYSAGTDSGSIENFATVMYQVDVYSNKRIGKKEECKNIAALIDSEFARLGFTRTFLNHVQNANEPTIYRMTGRYQGVVSKDQYVYRR